MKITRSMISDAVAKGVLGEEQGLALWDFLSQRDQETPTFKAAHILYYLGGLIAIGAMTLFMTLGWERFGGGGLVLISVAYCAAALLLTQSFLGRSHFAALRWAFIGSDTKRSFPTACVPSFRTASESCLRSGHDGRLHLSRAWGPNCVDTVAQCAYLACQSAIQKSPAGQIAATAGLKNILQCRA